VGRALIDEYLAAERRFLDGEAAEFTPPEYPPDQALSRPDGAYYCGVAEAGCVARLAAEPAALRAELATHAVLLERYRRVIRYAELKPPVQPSFYESFPAYGHILDGHKLQLLAIVAGHVAGERARVYATLREDMEHLRRHLRTAHSLLTKMVALSLLARDLDLLPYLSPTGAPVVPPLNAVERSLEPALIREFGSLMNFHRQLTEHPASIDAAMDGGLQGWLLRTLLRPNMSLNQLFPYYRAIAGLSRADAAEFNRVVTTDPPRVQTGFSLRNIGGSILNSIAAPDLMPYLARLHDVDAKIALLNAALALDQASWAEVMTGTRILEAVNPYAPAQRPRLDRETGALCFDGPLPDELNRRCIRTPGSGL
jgi:hypothetical protein